MTEFNKKLKISMIGAGSLAFSSNLISDILLFTDLPKLNLKLSLMDIDKEKLKIVSAFAEKISDDKNIPVAIETTTDLDKTLDGADYVIAMFQTGGMEARKLDMEIPKKYGVNQSIADTLGPGGVFKAIRTVPVLIDICSKMKRHCPDALLINYTNPMAINTWAINKATGIKNVGLCHGVEHSKVFLAKCIEKPLEEISFFGAGINHMLWFLKFRWKGKDAYPLLMERIKDPAIYELDPIRFGLMKYTGYFCTESAYHTSEYFPYFKDRFFDEYKVLTCEEGHENTMSNWGGGVKIETNPLGKNKIEQRIPIAWDVNRIEIEIQKNDIMRVGAKQSVEYAPKIIDALECGKETKIYASIMNDSIITNLPEGCCIEVPAKVTKSGIQPYHIGKLPKMCASLNQSNIGVQELAVKGILEKDKQYILQAIALDPLTTSILPLSKINKMVEEMFSVYAQHFPEYYRW